MDPLLLEKLGASVWQLLRLLLLPLVAAAAATASLHCSAVVAGVPVAARQRSDGQRETEEK